MKPSPEEKLSTVITNQRARGFTLVELLVSVLVLLVISGAVFKQIIQIQKRANAESVSLDTNQQARDFLDQTVRDLHMAGYPSASMYSNPTDKSMDKSMVAAGLVSVSSTQIIMEGDVDNDGLVQSVTIFYVASDPNDANCPCVRRSALNKTNFDSLNQGTTPYYTETQFVMPPGTNPGQSGEDLFAYYDQNGVEITLIKTLGTVDISMLATPTTPSGQSIISSIKTVKINLTLLNRQGAENNFIRTSMSAVSRLN